MPAAPRPYRPRPAPPAGVGTVATPDDEPRPHRPAGVQPIRVPSLLASLRRHVPVDSPAAAARSASIAAIASGATLFVVAALVTPVVSAPVAAHQAARPGVAAAPSPTVTPSAAVTTAAPVVVADKLPQLAPQPAPADPGAISALAANGIPTVALNAYRVAAARVDHADVGCGIDWSLLAGIGRAESDHGRFGGATLRTDGTSTPPIIGPALTGQVWDFIPASAEYIAVTGDAKYAHALGPMQFIPSTWRGYGADATGDGKADIFNINDAALGAARYLCAAGGNLATQAGRVKAVLAYNHNDQYLAQVLALADAYKRGVPISGIPVGNVTGALPKIGNTGTPPPVNPGAPTAVGKATTSPTKQQPTVPAPATGRSTTKPGAGRPGGGSTVGSGTGASGAGSGTGRAGTGTSGSGSGSGSGTTGPSTPTPSPSTSAPTPTPSKTCNPLDLLRIGC